MFESMRARIARTVTAGDRALRPAAGTIQRMAREDSRTRRGNIPCYGRAGNIPTTCEAGGGRLVIRGAGWVLKKLESLHKTEKWARVLAGEIRKAAE
jgi:hypothetical protein